MVNFYFMCRHMMFWALQPKKKYKNEKQNLIKTWVDRSEVKICDYINKYELKINKIFIKFSP